MRGIYDLSDIKGWGDFKEMFPGTSELDKMLQHSVGAEVKDITQSEIDREESHKGSKYQKTANNNERSVTCPNCGRKFQARVYDN